MKQKLFIALVCFLIIIMCVFFFKTVLSGNNVILKGESSSWIAKIEVMHDNVDFFLYPKENNPYTGDISFSYKIDTLSIQINGYLEYRGHLHDKSAFSNKKIITDDASVNVSWDGKTETFDLQK